jgi:hypothetical protein
MARALGLLAAALAATLAVGSPGSGAAKPKPLCLGKRATIVGTAGANNLRGTKRADVIAALGGNDAVDGLGGNDLVCGGPGLDSIVGGAGSDRIDGGPAFDVCRAGEQLKGCEETRPDASRGPLEAGEYTTDLFRPRFSFAIPEGWQLRHREPTAFQLLKRLDPKGLILEFDSFGGTRSVASRIGQFAEMQGVRAEAPVPVTVGGATGQRVDLFVTATSEIIVPGLTAVYELEPNDRLRVYVVSVRGQAVAILCEAQTDEFAGFFAEADKVLASVKWS